MSKLNNKQKSKIRREVDIDLGVKAPKTIIFKSKKIYSRKLKHKKDEQTRIKTTMVQYRPQ